MRIVGFGVGLWWCGDHGRSEAYIPGSEAGVRDVSGVRGVSRV